MLLRQHRLAASLSQEVLGIMRVAEGRVIEDWGSNDDLGLMRQLGVIQEPSAVF